MQPDEELPSLGSRSLSSIGPRLTRTESFEERLITEEANRSFIEEQNSPESPSWGSAVLRKVSVSTIVAHHSQAAAAMCRRVPSDHSSQLMRHLLGCHSLNVVTHFIQAAASKIRS